MNDKLNWRSLASKLGECLRDDCGAALAEYLIITGILVPLVCYLFHPDNGFYQLARDQYKLTSALLMYPGP